MSDSRLPYDSALERDVIGSCLARPESMIALGLTAADFAGDAESLTWQALLDLQEGGERIDLVRLRSKLLDRGKLQVVGGESFLGALRYVMNPVDLPVERLRTLTRMREMRVLAERAAATCASGNMDEAVSALASANTAALSGARKQATQNVLDLCMGLLVDLSNEGKSGSKRIHPGYPMMEKHLGMIPEGITIAVLASTNVGKSSWCLEALLRAVQRGEIVGYLSVEDQEPVVRARIAGAIAGVSSRKILQRRVAAEDMKRIQDAFNYIDSIKDQFQITIMQGATDAEVCAGLSEQAARGVKYTTVDYIQKIRPSRTYGNKAHETSESASRITSHTQKLGLVSLLVSQCTRDKTRLNECPSKHDMKESGDLENMSDVIVGLWREFEDDFAPIWSRLLKVKWGGVGISWQLQRCRETGKLNEVAGSDEIKAAEQAPDKGQWSHRGSGGKNKNYR